MMMMMMMMMIVSLWSKWLQIVNFEASVYSILVFLCAHDRISMHVFHESHYHRPCSRKAMAEESM
jgi:hypothetical protein